MTQRELTTVPLIGVRRAHAPRRALPIVVLCVLCASVVSLTRPAHADDASALRRKAQRLSDDGRYDLALPAWQAVLAQRPKDPDSLIEAGISASVLKRYDLAHQYLDRAVAIAPRNSNALLNLGLLCLHEKKIAQAEDLFHQVLAVDPACRDANLHLGMIAEAREDLKLAKEYYIKETNIMGGTDGAWAHLFNLEQRMQPPRPQASAWPILIFFAACLLVGSALLAYHRIQVLRHPAAQKPAS